MKAIITCAGYASRLWPLTKETPKPLLTIKDKAIIHHIVEKIAELKEVDAIYVVVNDKFASNFNEWVKSIELPLPVKVVNDGTKTNESRLGQVGDIQFVVNQEKLEDDILVVAGDNLFNFSLIPAFEVFKKTNSIVNPLWDCQDLRAARQLGTVILNKDDSSFAEFIEKAKNPTSTLASLGIYFVPRKNISMFKQYIDEGNNADKMGYFITWLMKNEPVYGHVYMDKWFDIGWIEALEQARREFYS